jgi:histidinol dehydrogenase
VRCWRKFVAIEKVGLYIPGGTAPLFSTILMLGIPAQIAGCKEIVLCTPPNKNKTIDPVILYTAKLVGITKIYTVGGAQAIAAMACGTESIPQVYKIFGPGNQYVTNAKECIQQRGVAIDMPAGPSELLVIADDTCNPAFVASDLLSQAEHGTDSQVVLLSDSEKIIEACLREVVQQTEQLERKKTAIEALKNSKAISLESMQQCIEFSNRYAPEHLIIASEEANKLAEEVVNAGSVFLGNYSCESAGDYASGTNHTLPTNGYAKNYSGVSLDSFVKKITYQEINKQGIQNLGKTIEIMAEAEKLTAHKNAVTLRLKDIEND